MSIAELAAKYRNAAERARDLSDAKEQNRAADDLHECYKELRQTEDGRQAITSLMADASPYVRVWAAAHCLQWNPEEAISVLDALRAEQSFPYSFDAEITLDEYRKGRLSFDF